MRDSLLLRQEAFGLSARLFIAALDCTDDARRARLQHAQRRAERRYRKLCEKDNPPSSQAPAWLYETAKPEY